jgi:hypothetical protein
MNRIFLLAVLGNLAVGCTIERIQQDSEQALGVARITDLRSIERSSRWRVDDPGYLTIVAEYDPADQGQVALLNAAFAGVNRVYPQTVLDPTPVGLNGPVVVGEQPVELLMHIDIPAAASGISRFPIALVDVRTGSVIDRAMLSLQPSWWGSAHDPAQVAQLFYDYAAQLRPSR